MSVKRRKRKHLLRAGPVRQAPTQPNEQGALDFVQDRLADGRSIRVLTVIDTFTRECLALEVDTSLPSQRVTRALEQIIAERGRPQKLCRANRAELTSRRFVSWSLDHRIELGCIQPGKPVQNAFIESFNGRNVKT